MVPGLLIAAVLCLLRCRPQHGSYCLHVWASITSTLMRIWNGIWLPKCCFSQPGGGSCTAWFHSLHSAASVCGVCMTKMYEV
jgi:hypothetical protein